MGWFTHVEGSYELNCLQQDERISKMTSSGFLDFSLKQSLAEISVLNQSLSPHFLVKYNTLKIHVNMHGVITFPIILRSEKCVHSHTDSRQRQYGMNYFDKLATVFLCFNQIILLIL